MTVTARCENVSKHYGETVALHDLSFHVEKGQAVALLGPNGAGKSTALNLMQGIRQPTTGSIELFGQKPGSAAAMAKIGVTPQAANFPPQLTPIEMLEFTRAHFSDPNPIDYLVETFGLKKISRRRIKGFSGGELRRIALAMCFAGRPELVFLDEPTSGLDTEGQQQFQTFANQFVREGGSLVLTSHYWLEIENIAQKIVMIDEGNTVINGTIHDIKSAVNVSEVSFQSGKPTKFTKDNFRRKNDFWTKTTTDSDNLVRDLIGSKQAFSNLAITPHRLEDAIAIYRGNNCGQPHQGS